MTSFRLFILVVSAAVAGTALASARQKPSSSVARPQVPPSGPKVTKPFTAPIVIENTQELGLGQPRINVQLLRGKQLVTPVAQGQEKQNSTAGKSWYKALLDTGAVGHFVSKTTADRFGIAALDNSLHQDGGINGAFAVATSTPLGLALGSSTGHRDESMPAKFLLTQKTTALEIALERPIGQMGFTHEFDLVGMPAIRHMNIEIDPLSGLDLMGVLVGAGPAVRLLETGDPPKDADIEIPLQYIDYHQGDKDAPQPPGDVAPSPFITDVNLEYMRSSTTGTWLLDTGAAASVVSTKLARTIGLITSDGAPSRKPDFTLQLYGVEGAVKRRPGFVIDRLRIAGRNGKSLEFRNARVVVNDLPIAVVHGQPVVVDGIFGMNLLMPGISGVDSFNPDPRVVQPGIVTSAGAFDRIWINGPAATLSLRLRADKKS